MEGHSSGTTTHVDDATSDVSHCPSLCGRPLWEVSEKEVRSRANVDKAILAFVYLGIGTTPGPVHDGAPKSVSASVHVTASLVS